MADRVRTTVGNGAAALRVHPRSLVPPIVIVVSAAVAYILLASVTVTEQLAAGERLATAPGNSVRPRARRSGIRPPGPGGHRARPALVRQPVAAPPGAAVPPPVASPSPGHSAVARRRSPRPTARPAQAVADALAHAVSSPVPTPAAASGSGSGSGRWPSPRRRGCLESASRRLPGRRPARHVPAHVRRRWRHVCPGPRAPGRIKSVQDGRRSARSSWRRRPDVRCRPAAGAGVGRRASGEPPGLGAVRSDERDLGHPLPADQGRRDGGVPVPVLVLARVGIGAALLLPLAVRQRQLGALRPHWRWLAVFALVEIVVPVAAAVRGRDQAVQLDERPADRLGADHRRRAGPADRRATEPAERGALGRPAGRAGRRGAAGRARPRRAATPCRSPRCCWWRCATPTGPLIASRKLGELPPLGMTAACLALRRGGLRARWPR